MRDLTDSDLPYVYKNEVIAAAVVLPVVGICLTALRFYVRRRTTKEGICTDDILLIPALVSIARFHRTEDSALTVCSAVRVWHVNCGPDR